MIDLTISIEKVGVLIRNHKYVTDILNVEEALLEKCDRYDSNGAVNIIVRLRNTTTLCPLCDSKTIVGNSFLKETESFYY